ncbi:MAG: amidohydrolase [Lachnospiraceae bacterium]|nr:amidohydrolase [Lachnospiraceae bacterium]
MSDLLIVDAHAHLWDRQHGMVDGRPVVPVGNGKSDFGGAIRQMMPPDMDDNRCSVERLMANMDYAGVSGCVITQEYIDGNQDDYLLECKSRFGKRMKICSLYEENADWQHEGFDGVKICAGRLKDTNLLHHQDVFAGAADLNMFVSIDLAEGDVQVDAMQQLIEQFPTLRIAIGHFGMVTIDGWKRQIELAKNKNVYIESGGLTWLFNKEGYPYPGAIDAIIEAANICGMDKLMWGSDYPRTMVALTYEMSTRFILESKHLSSEDKKAFLGENAIKFYGFDNLTRPEHIDNML